MSSFSISDASNLTKGIKIPVHSVYNTVVGTIYVSCRCLCCCSYITKLIDFAPNFS